MRLVCLVDPARADAVLPDVRRHFASEPRVAVLIERRAGERQPPSQAVVRTRRRAPVAERDAQRALPPELRPHAHHLRLVQRMAPVGRTHEATGLDALVGATLALEPEATSELWWRISARALARLEARIGSVPDPNLPRALLGHILDELPSYEPSRESLTVWLDAVTDRYQLPPVPRGASVLAGTLASPVPALR